MKPYFLCLLASLIGCGEAPSNLVILELPLARNTALAEIAKIQVELFPASTECNSLVRLTGTDSPPSVANVLLDLTPDERRDGADRALDNLPASPAGEPWNIRIQAFGETELRIGYACHAKELLAGQTILIDYVARENQR
jgi:hypothetical protein